MKKLWNWVGTALIVTLLSGLLSSCGDDTKALRALLPPRYATDSLGWYIPKAAVRVYVTELYEKPPYYSASIPMSYKVGKGAGGHIFVHRFALYENDFVLDASQTVSGARTVDNKGSLLAEASISYFNDGGRQGRELKEYHGGPAMWRDDAQPSGRRTLTQRGAALPATSALRAADRPRRT